MNYMLISYDEEEESFGLSLVDENILNLVDDSDPEKFESTPESQVAQRCSEEFSLIIRIDDIHNFEYRSIENKTFGIIQGGKIVAISNSNEVDVIVDNKQQQQRLNIIEDLS